MGNYGDIRNQENEKQELFEIQLVVSEQAQIKHETQSDDSDNWNNELDNGAILGAEVLVKEIGLVWLHAVDADVK